MLGLSTFSACSTPDASNTLSRQLPAELLALLEPDTVRTVDLGLGVAYRYVWSSKGPWAVHVIEADLGGRCDLELGVLRAEARERGGRGRELVTLMAGRSPDRVVAAVNADFFTPEGATAGTEIVDGRVAAAAERPALAWRLGTHPWMGSSALSSDTVSFGWGVSIATGDGATDAVGGFPELLDEGARVGDLEVSDRASFAAARHPRTAVGYDPGRGIFWLVVVDGRQPPHSSGMTLPELASLFEAVGATEALNLDGGGSSVMVVDGRAVNRPSDATGERPVVNGLALLRDPRGCAPPPG